MPVHNILYTSSQIKTFGTIFSKQLLFFFTGLLYESKYKSLENISRNTKYNGNYAVNFIIGKEFELGNNGKSRTLGLNAKFFLNGGRKYIPLNREETFKQHDDIYYYLRAYNNRIDHVFQMNFTASYLINRPKVSHEILLDIQNLTNNQARINEDYYKSDNKIEYDYQLSIIPNFMYRIHF
ncbi:MAG: hypothetical protein JW717_08140 [Marinilabiliaceae bacterium]|nr:hypothetical protein [Marinilabiliaceae bacterium]